MGDGIPLELKGPREKDGHESSRLRLSSRGGFRPVGLPALCAWSFAAARPVSTVDAP